MTRILLFLLFILPALVYAQSDCDAYERVINEARNELAKGEGMRTDFVLRKLHTARLKSVDCANASPSRRRFPEIEATVEAMLKELERQRDKAITESETAQIRGNDLKRERAKLQQEKQRSDSLRQLAESQTDQLEQQARELENEKRQLQNALNLAEQLRLASNQQKSRAEAVLERIYFYDGAYGLATNGDPKNPLYGYINKELETLIDFKYQEALPFDDSGYAKVRDGNEYLLLSTDERKYRLAEFPGQLRSSTRALDLRRLLMHRGRPSKANDGSGGTGDAIGSSFIKKRLPRLIGNYDNLQIVLANHGSLEDVNALSKLTKLKELQLTDNKISELTPLADMAQLQVLRLADNEIKDVRPLAGLRSLKELDLSNNELKQVNAITGLPKLFQLDLENNEIKQFDLELDLPELRELNLSRNRLVSINGLSRFQKLTSLRLNYNEVQDISSLASLLKLESLELTYNELKNLSPLAGLDQLRHLDLTKNSRLQDLSPLRQLNELQSLHLVRTAVFDLSPLFGLTKLRKLDVSGCKQLDSEAIAAFKAALPACQVIME